MILLLLCLELGVPALGKGTYPYPHNYPGQGNTYNSLAYYQQLSPRRYAVNYQQQQPRVSKLRPSGTKLYQSYAVPPATNRYLPKVSHKRDVVLFTSPEFSYQYDTTGDPDKLRWASAALKENRIKLGASSLYNYRVIPKTSSLLGPTPVVRAVISPVTGARLPPPRRPPAAVRATAPAATPKSPLTYGVSFGAGVNPGSRLGAASSLSSPVKIFSAPVKTSDLGSSREPFGVTSFSSVTSSSPQTKKSRSKASSTKSSKPFGTAFSSRLTGRTLRQQPRLSAATATPAKTSSRPVARLSERQPYGVTFAALPPLHAQSPEKLVDGVTMSLGEATALSNNGEDSYASLVRSRAKVTRVGSGDSADTSTILKSLLSEKQKVFPNEGIGKAAEDQESRKPKTFIQRVRPGKSESLTAASKLAKTSPPQPGAEKYFETTHFKPRENFVSAFKQPPVNEEDSGQTNKVLIELTGNSVDYDDGNEKDIKYDYAYEVSGTNNTFGHSRTESREGQHIRGQYRVQMPDGRTQVVEYTADENGFHPTIRYEGEMEEEEEE